jgi:tetratricopeptide (TPR) repeat protein
MAWSVHVPRDIAPTSCHDALVASLGRNDPCACQSGKKYKKCCLAADQARVSEQLRADEQRNSVHRPDFGDVAKAIAPIVELGDSELRDLSNAAVILAAAGSFDEALAVCQRLLTEYPDDVAGLERSAMVRSQMGEHALAAEFYRRAFDFVNDPSRRHEYTDADRKEFVALAAEELELAEESD